jgi:hypothetical protein
MAEALPLTARALPICRRHFMLRGKAIDIDSSKCELAPAHCFEKLSSLRNMRRGETLRSGKYAMRVFYRLGFILACALTTTSSLAREPYPIDPPAEARILPYSGIIPACNDWSVISEISRDFWEREQSYWGTPLQILQVEDIHEIAMRANGPTYIPRRYCAARASFNDGVIRGVGYNISEDTGFSGAGWGVTWCVVGLDRNHAFSPKCKMTGP